MIATIKKNSREEIRLTLDMFNGHRLFNMRVFFGSRRRLDAARQERARL